MIDGRRDQSAVMRILQALYRAKRAHRPERPVPGGGHADDDLRLLFQGFRVTLLE